MSRVSGNDTLYADATHSALCLLSYAQVCQGADAVRPALCSQMPGGGHPGVTGTVPTRVCAACVIHSFKRVDEDGSGEVEFEEFEQVRGRCQRC